MAYYKKVAMLTSGGDAPGMNSYLITLIKQLIINKITPYVIHAGFKGLAENKIEKCLNYNEKIFRQGGTFLKTSRYPEFEKNDVQTIGYNNLKKLGIEVLITIGGNGTYRGAQALEKKGIKIIAIPATIDNDIPSAEFTIGYPTALETIVHNVSRIKDTMNSHDRGAIIEVMGHGCGDLAVYSALATNSIVSTNEHKLSIDQMAKLIVKKKQKELCPIVIVSEFIYDDLKVLVKEVSQKAQFEMKEIELSYLQRGGMPTTTEKINAVLYAVKTIECIQKNQFSIALGLTYQGVKFCLLKDALTPKVNFNRNLEKIINSM